MQELAVTSKEIEKRLDLFNHRVVEELYDVQKDPDCLVNLASSKDHQTILQEMQSQLKTWIHWLSKPCLAGHCLGHMVKPKLSQ